MFNLITSRDIDQIVNLGSKKVSVVFVPSRNGGINAHLLKPPSLIPLCFSPESFSKHLAEASNKGITAEVYCSQNVATDIDYPDDIRVPYFGSVNGDYRNLDNHERGCFSKL